MNRSLANAVWSVLEYLSLPLGMLALAPLLLHRLGIAAYGLWVIVGSAVSAGSILSSGFGDAVIQRIAVLRVAGSPLQMRRVIGGMLAINLALGTLTSAGLWLVVPVAALHIAPSDLALQRSAVSSLRIGCIIVLLRSLESVFIAGQRAFEQYGPAVALSTMARVLSLIIAVSFASRGVPRIMAATSVVAAAATLTQWFALRRHLPQLSPLPSVHRDTLATLGSFGGFSWLQAAAGIAFSQADRLLLGLSAGAPAVAYFGICAQMTQPIHGLAAAGFHCLFPHLSSRVAAGDLHAVRRILRRAAVANLLFATLASATLILFGPRLLALWMGPAFASQSGSLLPLLALGFALLSLNVPAHYALLAFRNVRAVTALNLAGGTVMLLAMAILIQSRGAQGAALARLFYGPITWLMAVPLLHSLSAQAGVQAKPALEDA